jgi:hypothetical protein
VATHHGRPGGRLVEVLLALGLVVLSAGTIMAGLALSVAALMAVYVTLFRVSPILAYGLLAAGGGLTFKFVVPIMTMVWKGIAAVWRPFLRYYRYEAHTLRPIKDEKTAAPANGREKNEG